MNELSKPPSLSDKIVCHQYLYKDYGNCVVQHTLPEDESIEVDVHIEIIEDGEDGDRVRGRDQGSEVEIVDEGNVLKMGDNTGTWKPDYSGTLAFSKSPCNPIHEASNSEGADNSSNEGEGENGPNVAEEVLLLHRIASVEDDRRKKDVEEDFRVEGGFFIDLVVRSISNLGWKCEMGRNGEPPHLLRLWIHTAKFYSWTPQ